ncbi:divalent cation tolerance protein CutA [Peptoniphilus sp.]|jgi:hypothetical protein|uniref:divalent cation tolerance protein CutA n=1 Tax=Peptoniphilus sp. TaxID=1971214 RepID=UPI003D937B7E
MKYVKIEVFVPEKNVKDIISNVNEYLKDNNYDYVYSSTKVLGHFRPLDGADPYLGSVGKVEEVDEVKLEFRVKSKDAKEVYQIIKREHPYEVPIINVIELVDLD